MDLYHAMDLNKRQLSCQRVHRVFSSAFRVHAAYNVKNASFSSGRSLLCGLILPTPKERGPVVGP